MAFPRRRPQHGRYIGHDETRCCHWIIGAEEVVIVSFAREVDQLLQRRRCGPGILITDCILGFRRKPLEGEPPARALARRHPPVPAIYGPIAPTIRSGQPPHRTVSGSAGSFVGPAGVRACRSQARPRYAPARSPCRASRGSTVPFAGDPRRAPTPLGKTSRGSFVSPTRARLSPPRPTREDDVAASEGGDPTWMITRANGCTSTPATKLDRPRRAKSASARPHPKWRARGPAVEVFVDMQQRRTGTYRGSGDRTSRESYGWSHRRVAPRESTWPRARNPSRSCRRPRRKAATALGQLAGPDRLLPAPSEHAHLAGGAWSLSSRNTRFTVSCSLRVPSRRWASRNTASSMSMSM